MILVTGDLTAEVNTELGQAAEICVRVFLPELADLLALVLAALGGQHQTPSNTLGV